MLFSLCWLALVTGYQTPQTLLLLPTLKNGQATFVLEASLACPSWTTDNRHIKIELLNEGRCHPRVRVFTVSDLPQDATLTAEDLDSGILQTVSVRTEDVHTISVSTYARQVKAGQLNNSWVIGYDAAGNSFSTLDGLKFEWELTDIDVMKPMDGADIAGSTLYMEALASGTLQVQATLLPPKVRTSGTSIVSKPVDLRVEEFYEVLPKSGLRVCQGCTIQMEVWKGGKTKVELPSHYAFEASFPDTENPTFFSPIGQDGLLAPFKGFEGNISVTITDTRSGTIQRVNYVFDRINRAQVHGIERNPSAHSSRRMLSVFDTDQHYPFVKPRQTSYVLAGQPFAVYILGAKMVDRSKKTNWFKSVYNRVTSSGISEYDAQEDLPPIEVFAKITRGFPIYAKFKGALAQPQIEDHVWTFHPQEAGAGSFSHNYWSGANDGIDSGQPEQWMTYLFEVVPPLSVPDMDFYMMTANQQQITPVGGSGQYHWVSSDIRILRVTENGLLKSENKTGTVTVTIVDANLPENTVVFRVNVQPVSAVSVWSAYEKAGKLTTAHLESTEYFVYPDAKYINCQDFNDGNLSEDFMTSGLGTPGQITLLSQDTHLFSYQVDQENLPDGACYRLRLQGRALGDSRAQLYFGHRVLAELDLQVHPNISLAFPDFSGTPGSPRIWAVHGGAFDVNVEGGMASQTLLIETNHSSLSVTSDYDRQYQLTCTEAGSFLVSARVFEANGKEADAHLVPASVEVDCRVPTQIGVNIAGKPSEDVKYIRCGMPHSVSALVYDANQQVLSGKWEENLLWSTNSILNIEGDQPLSRTLTDKFYLDACSRETDELRVFLKNQPIETRVPFVIRPNLKVMGHQRAEALELNLLPGALSLYALSLEGGSGGPGLREDIIFSNSQISRVLSPTADHEVIGTHPVASREDKSAVLYFNGLAPGTAECMFDDPYLLGGEPIRVLLSFDRAAHLQLEVQGKSEPLFLAAQDEVRIKPQLLTAGKAKISFHPPHILAGGQLDFPHPGVDLQFIDGNYVLISRLSQTVSDVLKIRVPEVPVVSAPMRVTFLAPEIQPASSSLVVHPNRYFQYQVNLLEGVSCEVLLQSDNAEKPLLNRQFTETPGVYRFQSAEELGTQQLIFVFTDEHRVEISRITKRVAVAQPNALRIAAGSGSLSPIEMLDDQIFATSGNGHYQWTVNGKAPIPGEYLPMSNSVNDVRVEMEGSSLSAKYSRPAAQNLWGAPHLMAPHVAHLLHLPTPMRGLEVLSGNAHLSLADTEGTYVVSSSSEADSHIVLKGTTLESADPLSLVIDFVRPSSLEIWESHVFLPLKSTLKLPISLKDAQGRPMGTPQDFEVKITNLQTQLFQATLIVPDQAGARVGDFPVQPYLKIVSNSSKFEAGCSVVLLKYHELETSLRVCQAPGLEYAPLMVKGTQVQAPWLMHQDYLLKDPLELKALTHDGTTELLTVARPLATLKSELSSKTLELVEPLVSDLDGWSCEDPGVCSFAEGHLKALAPGRTTIKFAGPRLEMEAPLQVIPNFWIEFDKTPVTLSNGEPQYLVFHLMSAAGHELRPSLLGGTPVPECQWGSKGAEQPYFEISTVRRRLVSEDSSVLPAYEFACKLTPRQTANLRPLYASLNVLQSLDVQITTPHLEGPPKTQAFPFAGVPFFLQEDPIRLSETRPSYTAKYWAASTEKPVCMVSFEDASSMTVNVVCLSGRCEVTIDGFRGQLGENTEGRLSCTSAASTHLSREVLWDPDMPLPLATEVIPKEPLWSMESTPNFINEPICRTSATCPRVSSKSVGDFLYSSKEGLFTLVGNVAVGLLVIIITLILLSDYFGLSNRLPWLSISPGKSLLAPPPAAPPSPSLETFHQVVQTPQRSGAFAGAFTSLAGRAHFHSDIY